jgi:hypothetical protein
MSTTSTQQEDPVSEERGPTVALHCPLCGQLYQPQDLICGQCGAIFTSGGETHYFTTLNEAISPTKQPIGQVSLIQQKPITFDIEGHPLPLPLADTLIIGRATPQPNSPQPDVDLSPFAALEKGVSRRHVRLQRTADLVHITDLDSSNGTWLNGKRLLAHASARLLRNGDELYLGQLRIKVRF